MRAGKEPYYDVKYEWTFSGDPKMSVSGKNIIIDVTEDFAEQTKDEIRTWIQQLQAAMASRHQPLRYAAHVKVDTEG